MRVITSVAEMQAEAGKFQRRGVAVGFVPTMGYLHAGHLSLVKRARELVGKSGQVVVSIYVNPTQFGPREDFSNYPRDLVRDKKLCRRAGVDLLFVPSDREIYLSEPGRPFSTFVVEQNLSRTMEGKSRPTHFRGVTTVVAKLFHIVLPQVAVFGEKDFQQAAIIRRMVRDLNFPIEIVVAPTFRERDGLAMSSRNRYLSAEERRQATVLWRALQKARRRVREAGKPVPAEALRTELIREIHKQPAARVDYIAFFDPATLKPVRRVVAGMRMALAVYVGKTRLIDNGEV